MSRPQIGSLGPFTGGLHNISDPSSIADNELFECANVDLDIDGTLKLRPPMIAMNGAASVTTQMSCIGTGIIAGSPWVFFSAQAAGVDGIYGYNRDTQTYTLIKTGVVSDCAIQIGNVMFFIPLSGSVGGYWNGTVWASDASMPKGQAAVFYKSRLWIVPARTLLTSDPGANDIRFTEPINPAAPTPLSWPLTNSISVTPGDGQILMDLAVYNDNLMVFKQDSTFLYAYDVSPDDGVLRQLNDHIGASNNHCVSVFDNSLFVYHDSEVYEVINYNFQLISSKILFNTYSILALQETTFMFKFENKLIVRFYDCIYCYNTETRTWSRWFSDVPDIHAFGPMVKMADNALTSRDAEYYGGSAIFANTKVIRLMDWLRGSYPQANQGGEDIRVVILTKAYGFGQPNYKRLAWWGAEIIVGNSVIDAVPVPANIPAWEWLTQIQDYAEATVATRLGAYIDYANLKTTINSGTSGGELRNKIYKFPKSVRFRNLSLLLRFTTDTASDVPNNNIARAVRVNKLIASIGMKELYPKQVNT